MSYFDMPQIPNSAQQLAQLAEAGKILERQKQEEEKRKREEITAPIYALLAETKEQNRLLKEENERQKKIIEEEKKKVKISDMRFWISTIISVVAIGVAIVGFFV